MYVTAFFLKLTVALTTSLGSFKSTDGFSSLYAVLNSPLGSVDDYHGAWFGGYWYPDI